VQSDDTFEDLPRPDISELRRQQKTLAVGGSALILVAVIAGSWWSRSVNQEILAYFVIAFGFMAIGRSYLLRSKLRIATGYAPHPNDRLSVTALVFALVLTMLFGFRLNADLARRHRIQSVGECWAVDQANTYSVDCTNPAASLRTTDVVDVRSDCPDQYLSDTSSGKFICVEKI